MCLFQNINVHSTTNIHDRSDTVFINKKNNHYYLVDYYDNNKIKSKDYFIKNKNYKYDMFSEKGNLVETSYLDSTNTFSLYKEEYYENGRIKISRVGFGISIISDTSDKEGIRELKKIDGHWISYYENGNMEEEGTIINGKLNGVSRTYYENGKLKEEVYHYNNQLIGLHRWFDVNGNITKSDSVFSPGSAANKLK